MKSILLHFLTFTYSLLLLTACKIDGEEEITILSDGSGDVRVHFILPYQAFSKKDASEVHSLLEEITTRHSELSLLENDSCPYGNYCQALKLHLRFDSALDLERIILSEEAYFKNQPSPSASNEQSLDLVSALLGSIDAGIQPWGVDYHRRLDLSPLFKGKIKNGSILGDAEFRYILNSPMVPDSHNAETLDESSGKLVWKVPLKTYFDKPFTLRAYYARDEFRLFWALSLLLGVTLFIWLYKRTRLRRKTQR